MLTETKRVDPWTQTITLLSVPGHVECIGRPDRENYVARSVYDAAADARSAKARPIVRVIDRPTALTVTLDWRDSTECCYREQLWVAARARVSGACAMSGDPIEAGDDIFRPRPARPVPRNVGAMILASAVDACAPRDSMPEASFIEAGFDRTPLPDLQDFLLELNVRF